MDCAVMTTINSPRREMIESVTSRGFHLVVAGDEKTPREWSTWTNPSIHYLSLAKQREIYPDLDSLLPINTYARKNFAYLYALNELNASSIFEIDDDTSLLADPRIARSLPQRSISDFEGWVNPYPLYFGQPIWPRGFPLRLIQHSIREPFQLQHLTSYPLSATEIDIYQFVVNGDPDLDAICRLTSPHFRDNMSSKVDEIVVLHRDQVSPANTQSTWWSSLARPEFLYFPFSVPMRYADILKMLIAQTVLSLAYGPAVSEQKRNDHDYMSDFQGEFDMYINVEADAHLLRLGELPTIHEIYSRLVSHRRILSDEARALTTFCAELNR